MGFGSKLKNFFTVDYDEDYDEYYEDEYDVVDEPTKKQSKASKKSYYERAEEEMLKEEKASKSYKRNKNVVPMRPSRGFEVKVIKPIAYDYVTEILDNLLDGRAVILNFEGLKLDVAQRIVDSVSGGCYAVAGNFQRVSGYIYLVTPGSIDISGDLMDIVNGIDANSSNTSDYEY